jgi:hypothetical protein
MNPSPFGTEAPVPIARLFDTNQYDGTNPQVTTQNNIGLSEYTNANFLSSDTMFTDNLPPTSLKYFPYPKRASAVLWGPYGVRLENFHIDSVALFC